MNERRLAKERSQLLKERFFFIKWLSDESPDDGAGDDVFDILRAKDIFPTEGTVLDVLQMKAGQLCRAKYKGKLFPARIQDFGKQYYNLKFKLSI